MAELGFYHDFKFYVDNNTDPSSWGSLAVEHLICPRLRAKKPVVVFISGDSGEGKSYTALKILDIVNQHFGADTYESLDDTIVFLPQEYSKKIDNLLFNRKRYYRRLRCLIIDEAREVLPAKLWYNFINRAIADVNAMARGIRPIALIIISQFIRDIDKSMRYTLTYKGDCYRPLQGSVKFRMFRLWKDDSDLENPRLKKRKVRGYIINRDEHRGHLYIPKFFEVSLPDKKVAERYDNLMVERKGAIIRRKLEEILQAIEEEIGEKFDKVEHLVDYYSSHPELLNLYIERKGKHVYLRKEFSMIHGLTPSERKEFEKRMLEKLAEQQLAVIK